MLRCIICQHDAEKDRPLSAPVLANLVSDVDNIRCKISFHSINRRLNLGLFGDCGRHVHLGTSLPRCDSWGGACGDGVDVAGEVEIELLHGNDLAVAAAGRAALDTEGRALAGLADAGENFLAEMRAEGLAESNGGGGFAFAERRGRDGSDDDVLAVGRILEAVADGEVNLRFGVAIEFELFGKNAGGCGDAVDGDRRGGLGDFDITGDDVVQLRSHFGQTCSFGARLGAKDYGVGC